MKLLLLITLGIHYLFASSISNKILQLYEQKNYIQACDLGANNLNILIENESYLSLYAFSCLKADYIDRLNTPLIFLNQTPEARANASYFSMLVLQKKLLLQSLYDNTSIRYLNFPTSSHLLSKVFALYVKSPQMDRSIKEYNDPSNARNSYKLYTTQFNGKKTIAIDEYYDKILILHHTY
jgi:hypothetical protein